MKKEQYPFTLEGAKFLVVFEVTAFFDKIPTELTGIQLFTKLNVLRNQAGLTPPLLARLSLIYAYENPSDDAKFRDGLDSLRANSAGHAAESFIMISRLIHSNQHLLTSENFRKIFKDKVMKV